MLSNFLQAVLVLSGLSRDGGYIDLDDAVASHTSTSEASRSARVASEKRVGGYSQG